MASQPNPVKRPVSDEEFMSEEPLSAEEGWRLIRSLYGSAHELYAEYGGGEAFLKAERAAWGEDEAG